MQFLFLQEFCQCLLVCTGEIPTAGIAPVVTENLDLSGMLRYSDVASSPGAVAAYLSFSCVAVHFWNSQI